ncbi:hypothetical protein [Algibacter pacificus]|uniref:hypothetical protein n=1 Tax=Algibacter pacificus TaxID=2599389 RepID=UPI0011C94BF7|nr:hypothetical protein [Algibacter pacificus]
MNIFESINKSTSNAIKSSENYIKSTEEYLKLKIFQQLALSFSVLIKLALVGGFIFLGFIFLAIAGAIALGELLNSMSLGLLIVGGLLLLIGVITYAFRKYVDKKILRKMSKSFFD